jgi:hypothetical protein
MTNPPPSRGVPDDKYRQPPDAALGGADAVEKTTYVTGSGTDPERRGPEGEPARKGNAGTGPSATWAIVVFLFVGAVLVYVLGWGR